MVPVKPCMWSPPNGRDGIDFIGYSNRTEKYLNSHQHIGYDCESDVLPDRILTEKFIDERNVKKAIKAKKNKKEMMKLLN